MESQYELVLPMKVNRSLSPQHGHPNLLNDPQGALKRQNSNYGQNHQGYLRDHPSYDNQQGYNNQSGYTTPHSASFQGMNNSNRQQSYGSQQGYNSNAGTAGYSQSVPFNGVAYSSQAGQSYGYQSFQQAG